MDLCHRDYAFLSVPSLAIFLNPWSAHVPVTKALREGTVTVDDFHAEHGPAATQDLLSRLTSHTHELKHFHDILFTPYGNRLFLLAVKAVVASLVIMFDQTWRKRRVVLPLTEADVGHPEALRIALRHIADFNRALTGARMVMECSATFAQVQFVWTMFGEEHTDLLEEHLKGVPEYSALLNRIMRLGYHLGATPGPFHHVVHRLLLLQLGKMSLADDTPDSQFEKILSRFERADMEGCYDQLRRGVDYGWNVTLENVREAQESDRQSAAALRRIITTNMSEEAGFIADVYDDFLSVAHAFQEDVLADRVPYLDLSKYGKADEHPYRPLVYLYSDDDEASLLVGTPPPAGREDELTLYAVYEKAGAESYFVQRVIPASWNATTRLDRSLWVEFVKSFAPATTLIQDVDWRHPVTAAWLRQMSEHWDIEFERRM